MLGKLKNFFPERLYHWALMGSDPAGWQFERVADDYALKQFLGNDAIYATVDHICSNGSTLPYYIENKGKDVPDSDPYLKLMQRPNEIESREAFLYKAILYLRATGQLFILKRQKSVGFNDLELRVLPTDKVSIRKADNSDPFAPVLEYQAQINGITKTYSPDEVIRIRRFDPLDEDKGLSAFQAGHYVIDANNQLTVAEGAIFKNRGANNVISGGSGEYPMNQEDKAALDEGLKKRIGGAKNFNKTIISRSEIKVHKLDLSPNELRLIESYPNQLRRICTLLRLPAELFNAQGSGQFNTRREALKASYTESIIPEMEMLLAGIDFGLSPNFKGSNYRQVIDKSKIDVLNPSRQEQLDGWLAMFEKGAISREMFLELAEIDDQGKEFVKLTGLANGNQGQNPAN